MDLKCPNGWERMQIGVNENNNLFITIKNANEKPNNIEVKTLKPEIDKSNYTIEELWNSKHTEKVKISGFEYYNFNDFKKHIKKSKTKTKSKKIAKDSNEMSM